MSKNNGDKPQNEKIFSNQKAIYPFIKRLLRYFLSYPKWFSVLLIAILLNSVTEALMPLLWKYLIDATVLQDSMGEIAAGPFSIQFEWQIIVRFILLYLVLLIVNTISEKMLIRETGKLKHHIIKDLRSKMFEKMQALSYAYYDKTSAGWLVARMTYDTERLSEIMSHGIINFVGAGVMIIACLIAMFTLNVNLTLIVVISIPLILLLSLKIKTLVLKYAREARRVNSEIIGYFTENLNAIEVVRANAIEDHRYKGYREINHKLRKASYRTSFFSSFFNPVLVFLGSLVAGIILLVGGHLSFALGTITIGTFGAFFAYVRTIFMPVFELARTYASTISSLSAGERIFSLIDEPISQKEHPQARKDVLLDGAITFHNVSFGYTKEQTVLKNFNLHIKTGESVAIVGSSGGGKTTLISLLCRFYDIDEGHITLNNHIDLQQIKRSEYLDQLGIIPQVPHIFSGSVRSNIAFHNEQITEREIIDTLTLIGAEDLIERLHEPVGIEGSSLSNGQKQLISFARAILKKPNILIMDEATSSMDAISELKIRNSIHSIIGGQTTIIIAHRLSTIKECKRIIFIKNGGIAEEGSHEALMERQGNYYQYYNSYQLKATV